MNKLDLNKIRKEKQKAKTEGVLELKLPGQADAIKAVEDSVNNLTELLESKDDYDFSQIKQEITHLKAIIEQRLDFKPLTKSLDEFTSKIASTQTSVTKQNKQDLSKLIKSFEDTIKQNKPVVNVKASNTMLEYRPSDDDFVSDNLKYLGFVSSSGAWYIMRISGTNKKTYRYFSGISDYSKNWSDRSVLAYKNFGEIRL